MASLCIVQFNYYAFQEFSLVLHKSSNNTIERSVANLLHYIHYILRAEQKYKYVYL